MLNAHNFDSKLTESPILEEESDLIQSSHFLVAST